MAGKLKHQLFSDTTQTGTHWEKPTPRYVRLELAPGYVRLDVDASVRDHNQAAVGGLIRDDRGRWIIGFMKSIGTFPVAVAEVLAIMIELEVCQHYKFQKIQVCSDSLEALNILLRDSTSDHPFKAEIKATRQLMYEDWQIVLSFSSRETIECVDILAREAHANDMQLRVVPHVHPRCRTRFMLDITHVRDELSSLS